MAFEFSSQFIADLCDETNNCQRSFHLLFDNNITVLFHKENVHIFKTSTNKKLNKSKLRLRDA